MIDKFNFMIHKENEKATMESDRMPTINDIPEIIKDHMPYFITGSVIFGCATEKSDLDICIPIMYQPDIKDYIESNYNNGIKFKHNDVVINLIRLHPVEYVAWHNAVTMANSIELFKNSKDKNSRYSLYQMLRSIAILNIGSEINSVNYLAYLK
jgi:hypothetical protein